MPFTPSNLGQPVIIDCGDDTKAKVTAAGGHPHWLREKDLLIGWV